MDSYTKLILTRHKSTVYREEETLSRLKLSKNYPNYHYLQVYLYLWGDYLSGKLHPPLYIICQVPISLLWHTFQHGQRNLISVVLVLWHSLYKHFLYVTKLIQTFYIRDRVYMGQSLYGTKFIRGQSLYEDKVYTGTKFILDKVYTRTKFIQGQSLYKLFFSYSTWSKRLIIKC